jgi:hypothetical protein
VNDRAPAAGVVGAAGVWAGSADGTATTSEAASEATVAASSMGGDLVERGGVVAESA